MLFKDKLKKISGWTRLVIVISFACVFIAYPICDSIEHQCNEDDYLKYLFVGLIAIWVFFGCVRWIMQGFKYDKERENTSENIKHGNEKPFNHDAMLYKNLKSDHLKIKNTKLLTKITVILIWVQIIIACIALLLDVFEYDILIKAQDGMYISENEFLADTNLNEKWQELITNIDLFAFFVTGLFVLSWIYITSRNNWKIGALGLKFLPIGSVIFYFVPIFNLYKPYQAMLEIWKSSKNPVDWKSQKVDLIVPLWWFFWIISNFLALTSFGKLSDAIKYESIEESIISTILSICADIGFIFCSYFLLCVIKGIYQMQALHIGNILSEKLKSEVK